jgi:hypothetical protein
MGSEKFHMAAPDIALKIKINRWVCPLSLVLMGIYAKQRI